MIVLFAGLVIKHCFLPLTTSAIASLCRSVIIEVWEPFLASLILFLLHFLLPVAE